jgi:hypothetical protein
MERLVVSKQQYSEAERKLWIKEAIRQCNEIEYLLTHDDAQLPDTLAEQAALVSPDSITCEVTSKKPA